MTQHPSIIKTRWKLTLEQVKDTKEEGDFELLGCGFTESSICHPKRVWPTRPKLLMTVFSLHHFCGLTRCKSSSDRIKTTKSSNDKLAVCTRSSRKGYSSDGQYWTRYHGSKSVSLFRFGLIQENRSDKSFWRSRILDVIYCLAKIFIYRVAVTEK